MHFRTPHAVQVAVAAVALALLGSGAVSAEKVRLENGDQLVGEVVERDDERLVLEHPVLGRLTIPVDDHVEKQAAGLFGTSWLAGWKRVLSAGLAGSEGESSDVAGDLQLHLGREGEKARQLFQAAYFTARSNGTQSTNRFFAQFSRDWLRGESPWFWSTQGRYDYDEFRAWDHRLSGSAGVGYEIYDTDRFDLRGRLASTSPTAWV